MCFTCKQAVFPKYIDSTLLKYHISIKKLQVRNSSSDTRSVEGKPTNLESQYAAMPTGVFVWRKRVTVDIHIIFCLYKEQKHSFRRLAVVTLLTFGVSNLLQVHFHRKFWFIAVRSISQRLRQMCVLGKLNFKIPPPRGGMPPDPPSVLAPLALDPLSACQLWTASTDHVVMPKMVKNTKLKLIKR